MPSEYMPYVTNNANTFVRNQLNIVACVYCKKVYKTKYFKLIHNCLVCERCGIDALMVVSHSPLFNIAETEQIALLEKWYDEGFTLI